MEQEEKLCVEVETVKELTYLAGRVSTGGRYEVSIAVRTCCGWVMFMECWKCSKKS